MLPPMEIISDRALHAKIYGEGRPVESSELVPAAPVWGQIETALTKAVSFSEYKNADIAI